MDQDDRPEATFYDSGVHLPDHLHKTNALLSPLHFWEEDHCGPDKFQRYYPLSESQLHHTYQSFPHSHVWIILLFGLSKTHIQIIRSHTSGST